MEHFETDFRCGHCEGRTLVAYHPHKNILYTGGVEGEIRVWDLEDETGASMESVYIGTGQVNGIGLAADKFYVSLNNSHEIKAFLVADNELDATITRFTAEATTVAASADGKLIAAGGSDFTFKLIGLDGEGIKTFVGHSAPILSLAIDPVHEFVASSSCDGSVIVWDAASQKMQYSFDGNHSKSNDVSNSKTFCSLHWQAGGGKLLAVPSKDGVKLYARSSWKLVRSLRRSDAAGDVDWALARFNSDGSLLAAFPTGGRSLYIWDLSQSSDESIVFTHDKVISSLEWHPSDKFRFTVADTDGQYSPVTISPAAFSKRTTSAKDPPAAAAVLNNNKKNNNRNLELEQLANLGSDFEEEDDEDEIVDIETADDDDGPLRPQASKPARSAFISDEADVDMNMDEDDHDGDNQEGDNDFINDANEPERSAAGSAAMNKKKTTENLIKDVLGDISDDDDDDENSVDIGALKARYEPIINGDDGPDPKRAGGDGPRGPSSSAAGVPQFRMPTMPLVQKPFQPGATPKNLDKRLLVYNSVGSVTAHRSDGDDGDAAADASVAGSSIEVEFFDSNTHHNIHLNNSVANYTLGDLSSRALLLGSNDSEAEVASVLCIHFASWDANKEWKASLPEEELIEGLTVSDGFAAIISDFRYLRLYTLDGVALQVLSLAGNLLTVASQESKLLVVYHAGHGLPADQNLSFMQFSVNIRRSAVVKQSFAFPLPVAISPRSTLTWAGYTDEGTAALVDSNGVVRLLKRPSSWLPVVDMKESVKSKSDSYFVVGLSEVAQLVRGIFCKASPFPLLHIKPMIASVPFRIPVTDPTVGRAVWEEEAIRLRLLGGLLTKLHAAGFDVEAQLGRSHLKLVESLVKQFALALNAGRETLALGIAELMPPRALDGAMRYAMSKRRTGLIEKLQQIKADKLEGTADADDSSGDEGAPEHEQDEALDLEDTPAPDADQEEENNVIRPKPLRLGKNKEEQDQDEAATKRPPPLTTTVTPASKFFSSLRRPQNGQQQAANGNRQSEVVSSTDEARGQKRSRPDTDTNDEGAQNGHGTSSPSPSPNPDDLEEPDDGSEASGGDESEPEDEEERQNRAAAYELFFSLMREEFEEEQPNLSAKDLDRHGRRKFAQLDSEIRSKWIKKALRQKNKKMKTTSAS